MMQLCDGIEGILTEILETAIEWISTQILGLVITLVGAVILLFIKRILEWVILKYPEKVEKCIESLSEDALEKLYQIIVKRCPGKWISETVILSETPEKYIEVIPKDALEKFHQIIAKQYLKNVRFFGIPWQKKLFEDIVGEYKYGYKLTREDEDFVWRGVVDGWTEKDLSERGDYHEDDIQTFKNNVKNIKFNINWRICFIPTSLHNFFIEIASTAREIRDEIDAVLNDGIRDALTDIQYRTAELMIKLNDYFYKEKMNCTVEVLRDEISHNTERTRELHESIVNIANVYDRLPYVQIEIEKLMDKAKREIDLLNDVISKCNCMSLAEDAKIPQRTQNSYCTSDDCIGWAEGAKRLSEIRNDLPSILQKLVTIHDLVAELPPKDESPAKK